MAEISSEFVRETFLEFFRARHHTVIRASSVLAQDDPTLLFVNSGMAPLKEYFTGVRQPPSPNLTNIQPCIRTRDIDDIGDRHHLTFFEMMGSWSIGEYFKDKAVELAYELLIDGFGFDPRQLYVTVYEGDDALGVPPDVESEAAWTRVGMPADHIVRQPTADNFWGPAGDSGPCGPCTEVFLDTGAGYGTAYQQGGEFDTHRYIEIWNAGVFMVYDKGLDGRLTPLPFSSVDTGSGLERVTLALNGFDNLYETDLLAPVVAAVKDVLGEAGDTLKHQRIIADHLRSSVAIMAEGVRPSNEGAGYIPRRLLRRSATLALTRGQTRFDYQPILDAVVDRMAGHYPRFAAERSAVEAAIGAEMAEFEGALKRGLAQLDDLLSGRDRLTGADAFRLWSTYGLPVEIAVELAGERGATVDLDDIEEERRRHQDKSRGERSDRRIGANDPLPASVLALPATTFVGYEALEADGQVLALLGGPESLGVGDEADLIVDRSPLYAESGGQVGDHGRVDGPSGWGTITDTIVHRGGMFLHRLRVEEGTIEVGQRVRLRVEAESRVAAAANHSGTHLLNAALRHVLGDHVHQAGSLVDPAKLRFDFTHPRPVSTDEIDEIERMVNNWVLADLDRRVKVMSPADAIASGATSLEGETYPDEVRVISFDDVSTELCGGTHVERTSTLGLFRVLSEQSVASGVRRITAYTRRPAVDLSLEQARTLATVSATVHSSPRDVVGAVERLVTRASAKPAIKTGGTNAVQESALQQVVIGPFEIAYGPVAVDAKALRSAAGAVTKGSDRLAMLWTETNPATIVIAVPKRYVERLDAAQLLKAVLGPFGGSSGGSAAMAQGGGVTLPADANDLRNALSEALPAQG